MNNVFFIISFYFSVFYQLSHIPCVRQHRLHQFAYTVQAVAVPAYKLLVGYGDAAYQVTHRIHPAFCRKMALHFYNHLVFL